MKPGIMMLMAMGWAYFSRIGLPSIMSGQKGSIYDKNHGKHPVEQDANRRAFIYFNEKVDGFQDDRDYSKDANGVNLGWDFGSNSFVDGVGVKVEGLNRFGFSQTYNYVDYQNESHVFSLNQLIVRPKWYDFIGFGFFPISGPFNAKKYNNP